MRLFSHDIVTKLEKLSKALKTSSGSLKVEKSLEKFGLSKNSFTWFLTLGACSPSCSHNERTQDSWDRSREDRGKGLPYTRLYRRNRNRHQKIQHHRHTLITYWGKKTDRIHYLKPPSMFIHWASWSHPPLSFRHSLMSCKVTIMNQLLTKGSFTWQLNPSPEKPSRQMQSYDPFVFLHWANGSQW